MRRSLVTRALLLPATALLLPATALLSPSTALAGGGASTGPRGGFYPPVDMTKVVKQTAATVIKLRRLRVRGGLRRSQVRRALVAAGPAAQACTSLHVARLSGRVALELSVARDGTTRAKLKRSSLGLALIDFCVRGVYERLRFRPRRRPTRVVALIDFVAREPHTHLLLAPPASKKP